MQMYKIYTDGGFCNTQSKGVGSWAYILMKYDEKSKKYAELAKDSGRVFDTTNNKMELEAVFQAIKALEKTDCNPKEDEVEIVSDSMYVVKGSTEWVDKWKEHEWKTLTGKDVKNQDLWMKILKIKATYLKLKFNWVKGHDNDEKNIECDAMCQAKIREGVAEVQNETANK